jgi:hypothetical protein
MANVMRFLGGASATLESDNSIWSNAFVKVASNFLPDAVTERD